MKQIPLLQGKALLVELPEGAQGWGITKDNDLGWYIPIWNNQAQDWDWDGSVIALPPGNWRIIGMLSEVTEEQAKGVVDYFTTDEDFGKEDVFRDYKGEAFYDTALESFHSAIEAEGYYVRNPYGEEQPKDFEFHWGYLDELEKWKSAQQKVLPGDRTLILERI